jgi:hypothetical protein
MSQLRVGFRLVAQDSTVVLSSTDCDSLGGRILAREPGIHVSEVAFPGSLLNRGRYHLWVGIDVPMVCAVLSVDRAVTFSIEAVAGVIADINDGRIGVIAPVLQWKSWRLKDGS